ncbi:hypothetical protein FNV43_RR16922 [Rhamnella rubrinervis]|uniref:Uncharacterized protein n=1 Tax=Rhamnella rubrinervis TaxID=2594499 RepID=A0A8K0ME71_9ROSA|nr:hypothetical protein FNV43_RR16922 [Rhamnella rubrinervis]
MFAPILRFELDIYRSSGFIGRSSLSPAILDVLPHFRRLVFPRGDLAGFIVHAFTFILLGWSYVFHLELMNHVFSSQTPRKGLRGFLPLSLLAGGAQYITIFPRLAFMRPSSLFLSSWLIPLLVEILTFIFPMSTNGYEVHKGRKRLTAQQSNTNLKDVQIRNFEDGKRDTFVDMLDLLL